MLVPFLFMLVMFAALAGVVRPYKGLKRWHFALAAFGSLVMVGATVPPLTPAQLAEREAARKKEAAEDAAAAAADRQTEQDKVLSKAEAALASRTTYKRSEYRQTFNRVGAATFAQLGTLEPGAIYAAAESRECDQVASAIVSDRSKARAALWVAECANGNRFMVSQRQAELALARYGKKALAFSDLEASCTTTTVSECRLSVAQRAASKNEILFVSNCDALLEQALVSPSSLDKGRWATSVRERGHSDL